MKSLVSGARAMLAGVPRGALLLIASAALFMGGAHGFEHAGAHQLAQLGTLGAAIAIAVALAFCNWRRSSR